MGSQADDLLTMIESLSIDVKTELVEKILVSIHPLQKDIDKKMGKDS